MIEVKNLWKRYSGVTALGGISLTVAKGRVMGILGENGSGKSTLFKILAGVAHASEGSASISGQPVGVQTRRITSYLPEVSPFYDWMLVSEQLEFLAAFYPGWDMDKSHELLGLMNVDSHRKVGTLSDGQRARLKVVSAFSWPSEVVLMDEPLGRIDPPSRRRADDSDIDPSRQRGGRADRRSGLSAPRRDRSQRQHRRVETKSRHVAQRHFRGGGIVNTWKTLYIKEIKDNRTLFILLPLLTVFLELVAVLSFDDSQVPSPHALWSLVPYAFLLILPFVLSHSFAQEVKGQTHYLLLSLPVSRAQIFAAKAAVVATLGIVLFALSSAGFIAVLGELHALAIEVEKTSSHALHFIPLFSDIARDILVIIGVLYLSAMAVMMGIAGGASGLKLVVRRFAGLASTAFVLGVLYFYFSTLPDVLDLSGAHEVLWFDRDSNEPIGLSPESIKLSFMFLGYSVFVGLASMGIGMWLFEKRAEA